MDGHAARALVKLGVDGAQQLVEPLAGPGAEVHRALAVRADIAVEQVGLVVHADAGDALRAEVVDELIHHLCLRDPLGVGNVDDVQQKVGILQLLKRRLEGVDELMRQLADEADRVGDDDIERVGDGQQPGGGVERIEQAVIRRNIRAGEGVEQRRFARVRIADDGNDRDLILHPTLALRAAHAAHLVQILLELVDLAVDVAAVGLELRFTGALGADGPLAARARLALQMRPHTDQARQQILVLRQLDLQAALLCFGTLGKNIKDQPAAVEHLHAQILRQHTHLRGRQVVVEDRHRRLGRADKLLDLRHLALADEAARIRGRKVLQHGRNAHRAGGLDERGKLVHALLVRAVRLEHRRGKTDKHHAVARLLHGFEFVFFHRNHLFCVSFLQYTQGNEKCKEKEVCFRRPLSQFLLVQTELLVELGHASAGIHQLLLAREEGVTL